MASRTSRKLSRRSRRAGGRAGGADRVPVPRPSGLVRPSGDQSRLTDAEADALLKEVAASEPRRPGKDASSELRRSPGKLAASTEPRRPGGRIISVEESRTGRNDARAKSLVGRPRAGLIAGVGADSSLGNGTGSCEPIAGRDLRRCLVRRASAVACTDAISFVPMRTISLRSMSSVRGVAKGSNAWFEPSGASANAHSSRHTACSSRLLCGSEPFRMSSMRSLLCNRKMSSHSFTSM
mmetsp:Transcript_70775/g.194182  ORF Transcript_70775/g.194182 Transcript_70775/m.194182 type:complete len:238 (-) Transcript_70775:690-1403(-)